MWKSGGVKIFLAYATFFSGFEKTLLIPLFLVPIFSKSSFSIPGANFSKSAYSILKNALFQLRVKRPHPILAGMGTNFFGTLSDSVSSVPGIFSSMPLFSWEKFLPKAEKVCFSILNRLTLKNWHQE